MVPAQSAEGTEYIVSNAQSQLNWSSIVITASKHFVMRTLFHRFPRKELLFLLLGVCGLSMVLLFAPYLRSMQQWISHGSIAFEGNSVSLPSRWIPGEKGHLFGIRRPGMTLLFPYESTIVIDPFAERWPSEKIDRVSDLWLRVHGSSAEGRFRDTRTGGLITFAPAMKCVSPSPSVQRHFVEIECLSWDSVHSFSFFGERDAVADFAEVSLQASRIAAQHPGIIFRK
jgi:hypothetical protein